MSIFLSCEFEYFWKYCNAVVENLKILRVKFILLIKLVQYRCFYIDL